MALASPLGAAQHKPRPLPLFLSMLRSETADAPDRAAATLTGLRRYQNAIRLDGLGPMPAVATIGRATIRDYGGAGRPVLFVPSLINPPDILDLDADRSLLRWLAGQGVRPLLLDWGAPTEAERALDIGGHVETLLLPLIAALGEPPVLVGYCLGGTMALAAAAMVDVPGLALIAAPWRFAAYPEDTRTQLAELWANAAPAAETMGLMPMEVLQAAFWKLDPPRTVAKFENIGRLAEGDPALDRFVRLEDWANDGPPLTFAAARELFHHLYQEDRPGNGAWAVGGHVIDPAALKMPILEIASTTDRIVPAAASAGVGAHRDLSLGHVGMIVSGRAPKMLWQPLAQWLLQAGRT